MLLRSLSLREGRQSNLILTLVVGIVLVLLLGLELGRLTSATRQHGDQIISLEIQERMVVLLDLESQTLQNSLGSVTIVPTSVTAFNDEFRSLAVRLESFEAPEARRVSLSHQQLEPQIGEFLELRASQPEKAREVLALRLLPELQTLRSRLLNDSVRPLRERVRFASGEVSGRLASLTIGVVCGSLGGLVSLLYCLWPAHTGDRVTAPKLRDPEFQSSLPLSFTKMALEYARSTGSETYQGGGYTEKVLRSLSNLLVFTAPDGTIRRVNDAVCRSLGYRRHELVGKPFSVLLAEEVEEGLELTPQAAVRTNIVVEYLSSSGNKVPMLASCSAVFHDDGSVNGMVVISQDISERRAMEEALLASERRLRQLMERLVTAQEEERRKAARDLHDGLLQLVIAAEWQLTAFRKQAPEDVQASETLVNTAARLRESIQEGRRLINNLRPPTLDKFGLAKSLRQDLEQLGRELGCPVSFEGDLEQSIPAPLETTAYRIGQEAMNNIRKHSQPQRIDIVLDFAEQELALEVTDKGQGFDLSTTEEGVGLGSMRERAELQGGTFRIQSEPGSGTTIKVTLPVRYTEPD